MAGTTNSERTNSERTNSERTSSERTSSERTSSERTRTRRIGAVGASLAAVLLVTGLTAPAASADDGDLRPRVEAACARVATASERLDGAIARLDAGASERGSLAWFEAAVARATANNRPRIAADLQRRLDRLTERRARLDARVVRLEGFAARCSELGAGA